MPDEVKSVQRKRFGFFRPSLIFVVTFTIFAIIGWLDKVGDYEKAYNLDNIQKEVTAPPVWQPSPRETENIIWWSMLYGLLPAIFALGVERLCVKLKPWWREPLSEKEV